MFLYTNPGQIIKMKIHKFNDVPSFCHSYNVMLKKLKPCISMFLIVLFWSSGFWWSNKQYHNVDETHFKVLFKL